MKTIAVILLALSILYAIYIIIQMLRNSKKSSLKVAKMEILENFENRQYKVENVKTTDIGDETIYFVTSTVQDYDFSFYTTSTEHNEIIKNVKLILS